MLRATHCASPWGGGPSSGNPRVLRSIAPACAPANSRQATIANAYRIDLNVGRCKLEEGRWSTVAAPARMRTDLHGIAVGLGLVPRRRSRAPASREAR